MRRNLLAEAAAIKAAVEPPTLEEVFAEFAPYIRASFCIAGGAVRDLVHGYTPKDYDIFCLGYPCWQQLVKRYRASPTETKQYRDSLCMTCGWEGRVVQIIWRKSLRTINSLLDEFDLDINQWAFDGVAVRSVDTTAPVVRGGTMRVINPQAPEKVLERADGFCRRFGMTLDPVSHAMLVEKCQGSGRLRVVTRRAA